MHEVPGLSNSGTFMGATAARTADGADVVILGIPFDCGTHPTRIGSRQGPQALRAQSSLIRPFLPGIADEDPFAKMKIYDLGDLSLVSAHVDASYETIEKAMDAIYQAGATPLTIGGDGAVTLPQLRAAHRQFEDLVFIHIDAHTDSYDMPGYNNATTFTRAAEEHLIETSCSFHIGARGTVPVANVFSYTQSLGYKLITGSELEQRGISAVLDQVKTSVGDRPVYLCFDMDFFDPSVAPGVATPTWGGPNAKDALALLSGLHGLNIVAVDINTLSPAHDVGGLTAMLAAHVALVCLHHISESSYRKGDGK